MGHPEWEGILFPGEHGNVFLCAKENVSDEDQRKAENQQKEKRGASWEQERIRPEGSDSEGSSSKHNQGSRKIRRK